jgi:ribosomal protein S18 acetylase RimI-like enzyme
MLSKKGVLPANCWPPEKEENRMLIIRPARIDDLEPLTRLLQELFTLETDFTPDAARQRAGLKLLLKEAGAVILIAENCGEVVGMCSVQTVISTAEGGPAGILEDMIVARSARGQGAGRALQEAAQRWAEARGLTRLQLQAEFDNEKALRFYFKTGWQKTGLVGLRKNLSSYS